MFIDLHTHTAPLSYDGSLSPEELIKGAKEKGLDGICITEHDWFWEPAALIRLAKQHHFLIIPGVELNTEDGHLLIFGLDRYVFGMHRASFAKKLVEEAGGAIVLAHPYRRRFREDGDSPEKAYRSAIERVGGEDIFQIADAIEVLNGRGSPLQNTFSLEVSQKLGMRGVGGSDTHISKDIGRCATLFEREIKGVGDLIQELKAGRFRAVKLNKRG